MKADNTTLKTKASYDDLLKSLYDDEDRITIGRIVDALEKIQLIARNDVEAHPASMQSLKIQYEITRGCNLHCAHCCADAQDSGLEYVKKEECFRTLDQIIECGTSTICLTGGEPLTHPNFTEIVNYILEKFDGNVVVMTNGTLLTPQLANLFASKDIMIDISLDGVDEESCSVIRGKGVFQSVIDGVNLLQSYGCKHISLSMVLTEHNIDRLDRFNELNRKLGTTPVPRAFIPMGRGYSNQKVLQPLYKKSEIRVHPSANISTCSAGFNELMINYLGDVYPCALLQSTPFLLGNIYKKLLNDIIPRRGTVFASGHVDFMPSFKNTRCAECAVNMFCWSCPAYFSCSHDDDALKQRCDERKRHLYEEIWGESI